MKKLISLLTLTCFLSNVAFADCDFSKGITPGPNHTFIYTEACHLQVGQLVQDNKVLTAQVADLTQAITLKDLALTKADQRTQLWMNTSDQLQDRVTKIDQTYKHNEFLYFGGGVLATVLAGFMTARLIGR